MASTDVYIKYLKQKHSNINKSEYLKEFEKLNTTTSSIYDLEGLDVLIILKDGTNLTRWRDVKNRRDVMYVSEDLSEYPNLSGRYSGLTSLKAIVVADSPEYLLTTENMFYSCESLVDISSLRNLKVSDVRFMRGMFHGCKSIRDFSALRDWNVSKVVNMEGMFNTCRGFSDLNPLRDWDVGNVASMGYMFYGCWSLTDLSALGKWNVSNVEDMGWMFCGCRNLINLDGMNDWKVDSLENIRYMFMGCESLADASGVNDWNVRYSWHVFYYCSSLKNAPLL